MYDEKAQAYLPPFYLPNDQMAIRAIKSCILDKEHNFFKHAEDYTLYKIGTFEDTDGEILSEKSPLGNCLEFKAITDIELSEYKDENITTLRGKLK